MRRIHSQWEVKAGADGQAERIVGVMMDDTEVYELARSLGDASAQLQLAVELADIAIWRHDLRSDRMYYNDRAYVTLGIPPRPEGMSIAEVRSHIHPDDLPEVLASAERALASDRPTDMPGALPPQRRLLAPRADAPRGAARPDGTPIAFLGVGLDITEQVEQRRQSAELERRWSWRPNRRRSASGGATRSAARASGTRRCSSCPGATRRSARRRWSSGSRASSTPTTASACASRRA